jgi:hypothetical protein
VLVVEMTTGSKYQHQHRRAWCGRCGFTIGPFDGKRDGAAREWLADQFRG